MKKEIVISIIIVFLVVISDFFTSNITDNRINDMNYSLNKMKENIINNESRDNKLILEAENIKRKCKNDERKYANTGKSGCHRRRAHKTSQMCLFWRTAADGCFFLPLVWYKRNNSPYRCR